jgi:predicted tellurium resistance membrane protein TerC
MEAALALFTLTVMEIVLGIDNIVFIAILVDRLPPHQRARGRKLGLLLALVMRLILLSTLSFILQADAPFVHLSDLGLQRLGLAGDWLTEEIDGISVRDLILLGGGLFLLAKSVHEMHAKIEGHAEHKKTAAHPSFAGVLIQIALIDMVFSLDSVITAVGMAEDLWVMVVAVILAIGVMLAFSGAISDFVSRHPTLKILALSFLILIGVMLVAEGLGTHINKGYIYFAMAFAVAVEMVNLKARGSGGHRLADDTVADKDLAPKPAGH